MYWLVKYDGLQRSCPGLSKVQRPTRQGKILFELQLCDLKRPICQQCARLKFSCPGYGHDLDVILRNQTVAVVSRNRRKDERKRQSRSSAQVMSSTVHKSLAQSVELRALTFLFTSSTILSKKDSRSSHGHLDFLRHLYDKTASDSALARATTWFAVLVLGLCDSGSKRLYCPEMDRLMSRALQSISNALKNPSDSITNETLTAVILLAHGDYLQYKRPQAITQTDIKMRMLVHQDGAEALIKKRNRSNFQDDTSIALFDAVRHNAVGLAFAGTRPMDQNYAMWTLFNDDKVRQLCDSYTFATELDACCLVILSLKNDIAREDVNTYTKLQTDLSSLLERLICWSRSLPNEWVLGLSTGQNPEIKSLDVCYLFNDWYLLQLAVRHLLKELRLKTMGPVFYASDFSDELDLIDNIMASESLFISTEQSISSDPHVADKLGEGRRLFYQTVEHLELIISDALEKLVLPHTISLCYRNVLTWGERER
ncbi:hypothetical protein TSTA_006010 [Talaromyces stipitatus ATCC 10500]|uniref:Zn(2)-C6 fungal-type domain-containing protein n=1 Tax=Talaromyces stipitatus (strain ATCC 10500 / CBS 375.48 / QM 6759 / NRRL 1006) TaxID=441959 RepID=B8MTT6_TALSN|nr:uncharacterized protein TSTA_006010 [Talaromyces stipitatus ATCC 10500]EED12571.1 hypothetical protein TSTA_006010 [Talaromyces stipitatus ATCC 10500]